MKILRLFVAFTLICFARSPATHAVVPAPDGGYPNGNTAEGQNALLSLTTGGYNTAVGFAALGSATGGSFNTAVGAATLLANTADQITATGALALLSNTNGQSNTANGAFALLSNTGGSLNTAVGAQALLHNQTGSGNVAIGGDALSSNTSGHENIAVGDSAGFLLTTGSDNIIIGTDVHAEDEDGTIRIGSGFQTSTYLAGIAGRTVGAGGTTCVVDNDGKLGVFLSARRFKTDIADMNSASEAVLHLRPVTFRYKPELKATNAPQFGLIAEEVAEVNPDLVTHDATGKLSTVRYEAVNVMLLNEFLKEHHKNAEQEATITALRANDTKQEATIAQLQKQIDALTAAVQKVSAQFAAASPSDGGVKLSRAGSQTVQNNR